MRPRFANPKTDFVFKRIFATEAHKSLLISLINDLLGRENERAITDLTYLREEQRPRVPELKFTVVDVKCQDAQGTFFVVEMQVLNVEGFEKRVVFNASKAYVRQLETGEEYVQLHDVIAISICDFVLWPDAVGEAKVPLVSRWRMREEHGGRAGLSQVQYVFVELPKLAMTASPTTAVEQWAYFFRHAATLNDVPAELTLSGPRGALDVAKTALFTESDWDEYERVLMAQQDARGALTLAQRVARDEGRAEGELSAMRRALMRLLKARFRCEADHRVEQCTKLDQLEHWLERAASADTVDSVFATPS